MLRDLVASRENFTDLLMHLNTPDGIRVFAEDRSDFHGTVGAP